MNFIDLYFNPSGRINRSTYWLFGVLLLGVGWVLIYALLFFVFVASIGFSDFDDLIDIEYMLANAAIFVLIFTIAQLINFWNAYAIGVKRLHDRNKSAWWVLIWYVIAILGLPLTLGIATLAVYIWALIWLGFLEGDLYTNRYGDATTGPYANRPTPQYSPYGGAPAGAAYLGDPGMQGAQYGGAPAGAYPGDPGMQGTQYGGAPVGAYPGDPGMQGTQYSGAPAGAYPGDPSLQNTQYGATPAGAYPVADPVSQGLPYGAAPGSAQVADPVPQGTPDDATPAGPYPSDPVPQDTTYDAAPGSAQVADPVPQGTTYDAAPAGPYPSGPVPQDTTYGAAPAEPYPSDPVPQDTPYDAASAEPYPSDPVSQDISDDAAPGSAHVEDTVPQDTTDDGTLAGPLQEEPVQQDTPYDAAPAEPAPVSPDQQNRSSQQRAASPPTLVAQQAEPALDFDASLNQTPASPSAIENTRDGLKSFYGGLDAEGDAGKFGGLYSLVQSRIGNAGVIVAGIVFAAFSVFARTDIFGSVLDYLGILGIAVGVVVAIFGVFMLGREKEWWGRIGALGNNAGNNGTQTARRTKICPYCAEEIMFEAIRCRFCGSDLPPDASAS